MTTSVKVVQFGISLKFVDMNQNLHAAQIALGSQKLKQQDFRCVFSPFQLSLNALRAGFPLLERMRNFCFAGVVLVRFSFGK